MTTEEIKRNINLAEYIKNRCNVEFTSKGKELLCKCPFPDHKDGKPSFSVNIDKNLFQCFGCARKGSIIDFVKACKENNIKPIAGIEFRKNDKLLYTGIAKNNNGFMKLNEFLSRHNIEKTELPDLADELEDVFFIYPFKRDSNHKLKENEFIGIKPEEINKIFSSKYKNEHSILWR